MRAVLELTNGFGVADELQKFGGIEAGGIQLFEDASDFKAHAHGTDCLAVDNAHTHAAAALARVQAGDGDERLVDETQARKMAVVQGSGDGFTMDPRRAELFKRSLRAAAHGNA